MADQTVTQLAEEPAQLAAQLIADHHGELRDARILYVFTNRHRSRHGTPVVGSARTLTDTERFLSAQAGEEPADFELKFDGSLWAARTPQQRLALVDHQLTHCGWNDKAERWVLRGHDLEEFSEVIQRHGLYSEELKELAAMALQATMALGEDATEQEQRAHTVATEAAAAINAGLLDGDGVYASATVLD